MKKTRRRTPKAEEGYIDHSEAEAARAEVAACFRCGSSELVQVAAKCNDLCRLTRNGKTEWDYVPDDLGLGNDPDYVSFTYCRRCGQMQNDEFMNQ